VQEKDRPTYDAIRSRLENAEAALRESEKTRQYLEHALEGSGIGTWEWNTQTNETRFNEQWAFMLGYTLAELGPVDFSTWKKLVHPEDLQTALQAIAKYSDGETDVYECEFRMRHKEGHWIWVLAQARSHDRDKEGKLVSMFGTHIDITERKRVEEALRENQEMLNEAMDIARIGGWKVDVAGNTALWTDQVFQIYELPIGEPPTVEEAILYYHEQDRPLVSAAVERSMKEGVGFDVEARIITAKQNVVWVRAVGHTSYEGGKPAFIWGTVQDITQRKHAEAERERLMMAIEQAAEAVVITDEQGTIQYVNGAFQEIAGYGKVEVLGQNPRILKSGKHGVDFYREMWTTLRRGETWTGRVINRKKNGSNYTVESVISPVRDTSGRIVNFVAVKRDITEELSKETQLRQAQKMEAVGRLAGGVAHDFNNMLGVILGNCELALMGLDARQPLAETFTRIQEAAERSATLTRQLLGFARKQTVEPKRMDLNEAVSNLHKMLKRLIGEEIRIHWNPGEALWHVYMDPGQIDQILMNLCVNAKDAIDGTGTVTLETENVVWDEAYCSRVEESRPGEYVNLSVKDDGHGMDPETLANIFEPFFTTKEIGKGTGLGLATVYGIVKQNHGFVHVTSEPGHGSNFEVYLPRYTDAAALSSERKEGDAMQKGEETILLVEDEPAILEVTTMILEQLGYTVLAASCPSDALNHAASAQRDIHLMITDVVMPEMNGRNLALEITSFFPEIKCLFMSGYNADIIAPHGVLEENVHFIQKPFTCDALASKIREVFDS
jgi:PAS domain S-box-containing protein